MPHLETHPSGGGTHFAPASRVTSDPETGAIVTLKAVPDLPKDHSAQSDIAARAERVPEPEKRMEVIKKALTWYTSSPQGLTVTPLHYPTVISPGPDLPGACSCGLPYYITKSFALSKDVPGSCQHAGKHPVHTGFASNPEVQATSPDAAFALWGDQPWNIGIVTGKSAGIVVFDVDVRADGLASMTALTEAMAIEAPEWAFTDTLSYLTSGRDRRGYHLIYRVSPDDEHAWRSLVRMGENILPGVELKWRRGIVVAAPSIHASGQVYELRDQMIIREMDSARVELLSRSIARSRGEVVPPAGTSGTRPGFATLAAMATSATGAAFGGDLSWENVASESRENPGYWSRLLEHILHTGRTPVVFGPGDHNDPLRALFGAVAKMAFAYGPYAESTRDTLRRKGDRNWIPAFYGSLCADIDMLVTSPEPWQKTDPENFRGLIRHAMWSELQKDGHVI